MSSPIGGWFTAPKPVIGVVHLPALPGSPGYGGSLEAVKTAMLRDAEALLEGGVHGLLLENFGDAPFFPGRVPAHVVAQMTALAVELRRRSDVPLGINVLRNDGQSALAVALACGAQFIRVNVLCGARVTDQGIIQGIAHDLLRDRARLGAEAVKIFADVAVKHSAPISPRPIEEEAEETLHRGGADVLIVSGAGTGKSTDPAELQAVKTALPDAPVLVGSGIIPETLPLYLPHADGFIIGTAFKRDGITTNPVDPERVRELIGQFAKGRTESERWQS